jgi:hypothetical protein
MCAKRPVPRLILGLWVELIYRQPVDYAINTWPGFGLVFQINRVALHAIFRRLKRLQVHGVVETLS